MTKLRLTRRSAAIFIGSLFLLIPIAAGATWTEAGFTILDLGETLSRLDGSGDHSARTVLPTNTPVLFSDEPESISRKALAVALLQSGLAIMPDGEIIDPHSMDERSRAERRHIPHFSVTPRGGDTIDMGGLVLFGEIHEPPFAVEVIADEIHINGVAVYPSPGPAALPPVPSSGQKNAHETLEAAGASYALAQGRGEAQRAREELAATMLERPEIEHAEWINDKDLQLSNTDGSIEMITFSDEAREADPDGILAEDKALSALAEGLGQALRDNYTVMVGASYLLTVTNSNAYSFARRVREIRESPDSEALKLARLQAWTGQRNAAADLLFNQ